MDKRIGILVVHGIGNQSRFEHLENVAKNFVLAAASIYRQDRVTVEIPPATEATFRSILGNDDDAPQRWRDVATRPYLTILIRTDKGNIGIDFREMWWRDLGVRPTLRSFLSFWFWAISLAGTHGYFSKDWPDTTLREPNNRDTAANKVSWSTRLYLYCWTIAFFLLIFPFRVVMRLAAMIPGLARIDVFRTVFAYMSSVQLYQERESKHGGALTDYDQARRMSIQRRFTEHLIDMAIENYEAWYVVGHSLGSVIAFKGLMAPGRSLARQININRWTSDALKPFKAEASAEPNSPLAPEYPDEPKRPNWMRFSAALNRQQLFARLRGFVTYGSPLEIFARLWPAIVPINREPAFRDDFEWINIFDPTDIVGRRPLRSFTRGDSVAPIDFPCVSSSRISQAHTRYLDVNRHRESLVLGSLVKWIVAADGDGVPPRFPAIAEEMGLLPLTKSRIRVRIWLARGQWLIYLTFGLILWPFTLVYFGRLLDASLAFLLSSISSSTTVPAWAPKFANLFPPEPDKFAREVPWITTTVAIVVLLMSFVHYWRDVYLDTVPTGRRWFWGGIGAGVTAAAGIAIAVFLFWSGRTLSSPVTPLVQSPEQAATEFFESIRSWPPLLRAFLQAMPKGGDIHSHLSGAVYAEDYIALAAAKGLCIDTTTAELRDGDCNNSQPALSKAIGDPIYRQKLIDAWSIRNFVPGAKSKHDQFFDAFRKFNAATEQVGDMLAEVASNAAAQHINYLELMVTFAGRQARAVGASVGWNPNLNNMQEALIGKGLRDHLVAARREIDEAERVMHDKLHCASRSPDAGCKVTIRYVQQADRSKPLEEVFASLVFAFELVKVDERVVGLNLVSPEDNPVALENYAQHMRMLEYLWNQQPQTNISLHAGELSLGLVPLRDLRSHIRSAVETGHARRIGHGVSVGYEDDALELLRTLAQRRTLIEVNLSSNEHILGVKDEDHPLLDYLRYDVPVTLSTDDEGISRSDLTNEYLLASRRYNLTYQQLKTFARNSLTFSFLPGTSLWTDDALLSQVTECANDATATESGGCGRYFRSNRKASQEWQLERAFDNFETQFVRFTVVDEIAIK